MIEPNLPEPPITNRECVDCGRKGPHINGRLIHWPSEDSKLEEVVTITGMRIAAFSFWAYTCRWCKGANTKRDNKRQP
jgi:hypothetical protein